MNDRLRRDAEYIVRKAIAAADPDFAVKNALKDRVFSGRVYLVAAGKAAWKMARAACEVLGDRINGGDQVRPRGASPARCRLL